MATTNTTTKNTNATEANSLPASCEIFALVHEMECLLSIIRTINEVNDPHKKSYLVDAADNIGTRMLESLETREAFEDQACCREATGDAA